MEITNSTVVPDIWEKIDGEERTYFVSPSESWLPIRTFHPNGFSKPLPERVTISGMTCPECKDTGDKRGYHLEDLPKEPDYVVQCDACKKFLWVAAPAQKEKVQ